MQAVAGNQVVGGTDVEEVFEVALGLRSINGNRLDCTCTTRRCALKKCGRHR